MEFGESTCRLDDYTDEFDVCSVETGHQLQSGHFGSRKEPKNGHFVTIYEQQQLQIYARPWFKKSSSNETCSPWLQAVRIHQQNPLSLVCVTIKKSQSLVCLTKYLKKKKWTS